MLQDNTVYGASLVGSRVEAHWGTALHWKVLCLTLIKFINDIHTTSFRANGHLKKSLFIVRGRLILITQLGFVQLSQHVGEVLGDERGKVLVVEDTVTSGLLQKDHAVK